MLEKIKMLIAKIKTRMFYNLCYNDMEAMGIAVFGMCGGELAMSDFKKECHSCPYFVGKGGEE